MIKLLTPSSKYTQEYNEWLEEIPHYIKGLVYIVKRFYKPEWENDWQNYFTVDTIDGKFGNELKFNGRKLVASYLRIRVDERQILANIQITPGFCCRRQNSNGR